MACAAHQVDLAAQFGHQIATKGGQGRFAVEPGDAAGLAESVTLALGVEHHLVALQVVQPTQAPPHADRPGDWGTGDPKNGFNLIQKLNRITNVAVDLVHKGENRRVAQPTNLHEFDGARLNPLGAIDDHEGGVDGRERAVSVFRKVLVPWGVQQVDHAALVRKLHHRGGHRDAPLFLHFHPVRSGVAVGLFAFDRSGQLNRLTVQQQLFGHGRLAGVGVGDDGESSALADFRRQWLQGHGASAGGKDRTRCGRRARRLGNSPPARKRPAR